MSTPLPHFIRDKQARFPASELLSLASTCIRELYWHYDIECRQHATTSDEDAEAAAMESQQDAVNIVKEIVPSFWTQRERMEDWRDPKDFPIEQAAHERARTKSLLEIGTITKSWFWIPDAVNHHRSKRPVDMAEVDMKKEDALLDLLVFLAEKRERAVLFELVE